MAINATAQWWGRTDGDNLNGGGYDSTYGGGVNYSDQASPQASWTNLTLSGSTLTDAGSNSIFTSSMVGNCVRVASQGYYYVLSYIDSNNVSIGAFTGATSFTGATGRLGGAWLGLVNGMGGGTGASPTMTTPVVPGNTINLRGSGTDDPTTIDYDYSSGYWTPVNGTTSLNVSIVGYNGRPHIKYPGLLFYIASYFVIVNMKFTIAAGAAFTTYGASVLTNGGVYNCFFEANGVDAIGLTVGTSLVEACRFTNGGTTTSGSQSAISMTTYGTQITSSSILNWRGGGISFGSQVGGLINKNIIAVAGGDSIAFPNGSPVPCIIESNTIYGNGTSSGHGINLGSNATSRIVGIRNNIITNHRGTGKYGITSSTLMNDMNVLIPWNYNNVYNNTVNYSTNVTVGANDLSVDPQFVSTATGNFTPQNTALNQTYSFPGSTTATYFYLGAVQPQGSSSGTTNIIANRRRRVR